MENKEAKKIEPEIYPLGEKFEDVHFSKQEARCMGCLLKGRSSKSTARALGLSPRTVEYYIDNMKKKLNCRTKFELVELVVETDFKDNIDMDEL